MGKGAGAGGRSANATPSVRSEKREITMTELEQHNKIDDAWIAWAGKVYDVSGWRAHPGGDVLFSHAGKDATGVFAAFHPQSAYDLMGRFYIGELKDAKKGKYDAFEAELKVVRAQLRKDGYFDASAPYYVYKFVSTVAFAAAAWWIVLNYESFSMHMLSAVLMAFFFQQCGWLAHDFGHQQVFEWHPLNNFMGWLIGNVFQGFSLGWWKDKHNTHHSIPNLHASEPVKHDGDPDVDTMPILAWSKKLLAQAPEAWHLKYQSFLYLPILNFARIAWAEQSFRFVFGLERGWGLGPRQLPLQLGIAEPLGLIAHYAWFAALLWQMPWTTAITYGLLSNCLGGLLIAIAFGVGHNGMVMYDHDTAPPFGALQVTTTRNVDDNGFTGWFCGGLHYQIEHHLFPTMPRHSLWKAAEKVRALCKKHDVPYRSMGLIEGNLEVMQSLDAVVENIANFPAM